MSDQAPVLPRRAAPRGDSDGDNGTSARTSDAGSERQSVSDLVRNYSDHEGHKRDRSESGDPAPAGKRGARELSGEPARSPSTLGGRNFKEHLENAIDGLESRLMTLFSRELHEFRDSLAADIDKLNDRVRT